MNRTSISNSSNILSIGYDPKNNILEVEFSNGGIYQYFDVPQSIFDEILIAESAGKFLSTQVKGVYRYAKL